MRTTIALDSSVRDRLAALRSRWGLPSVEAVVARLLEGAPRTASALYQTRKREVDTVLARHRIRRLVAFGSRARGDGRPDSDLDLAGDLPRGADLFDVVHLKEDLSVAFGVPVDFVQLSSARPRLRARIAREGVTLVGGEGRRSSR